MTFIVLEIQTAQDGTTGTLVNAYTNQNEAESRYHQVLAAAAISALPTHAAVLLTDHGQTLKHDAYDHREA